MGTLMHHILALIQKSKDEVEDRIKKRVNQQTEQNLQEVNNLLDAFELQVLARPSPTIDLNTFQEAVEFCGMMLTTFRRLGGPSPRLHLLS